MCALHATWSPAIHLAPPFQYPAAGSASGTYSLKQLHTSGPALHNVQVHADTCTNTRMHTQYRETDTCMDRCAHNISFIIAVDKLLLKDDCVEEFHLSSYIILGMYFPKKSWGHGPALHRCMQTHAPWGHGPALHRCMQTRAQTHTLTEIQMHAWMDAHIIILYCYYGLQCVVCSVLTLLL